MSAPFKSAATPVSYVDADPDRPEVPASVPRHAGNGNPKIRSLEQTARFSYYTRASKFGEVLENHYLIHRRELRAVAYGMGRSDHLVLAAGAVPAFEDRDNPIEHKAIRSELERIATEAMIPAGLDHAAQRGTALHSLSERADRGDDLAFLPAKAYEAVQQWRRIMSGFNIVGTEQFVVADDLRTAGSYDRLLSPKQPLRVEVPIDGVLTHVATIEPGERVIADLKSGRTTDYFGPTYAVQQWTYASGVPYVHVDDAAAAGGDNGRREWPDGVAPRRDWALIPHVPIDSPQDAGLLWVNLSRGEQLAELAHMVRDARKFDDLFYEAPVPVPDPILAAIAAAGCEADIDAVYDAHTADWTDVHTAAAQDRMGVCA